jgi:hypothetical protein
MLKRTSLFCETHIREIAGVGLNPRFSYDTNNSLADGSQCRCSVVSNEIRSCFYQPTTDDRSSMTGYAGNGKTATDIYYRTHPG